MEIKKNSFFPKLYRWFYGIKKNTELTTDGCEYLFKSIIAGLFAIPLTILFLPIVIWELLDKKCELGDIGMKTRFNFMFLLIISLLFVVSIGFVISTIWLDYPHKSFGHSMVVVGSTLIGLVTIIGGVIGVVTLIDYIKDEIRDEYDHNGNKIKRTPKNFLLAYYKAKKEKNCPIITWKD